PISRLTPVAPPPRHPLSLHDALPISSGGDFGAARNVVKPAMPHMILDPTLVALGMAPDCDHNISSCILQLPPRIQRQISPVRAGDRKSTRLNSSHVSISYAVFCLKKK